MEAFRETISLLDAFVQILLLQMLTSEDQAGFHHSDKAHGVLVISKPFCVACVFRHTINMDCDLLCFAV